MSERVLLVDYENVQKVDLAAIAPDVRVPFFFGASQRSVTREFFKAALRLGERFVPIDIEGQGKNALDFHIAYYLGEYLSRNPASECVILSRDKGFDPLVRHLTGRGFKVRRVGSQAEAFPESASAVQRIAPQRPDGRVQRIVQLLSKIDRNRRPRQRRTLVAQVASFFQNKLSDSEVEMLVSKLEADGLIADGAGRVTYNF